MIVSYNWLKELVKLNVSAEKLAEEMSLYSVEVESFKKLIDATNLVVGLVTSKKRHENSDHLNVCMVNFGDYDLQIVCGAPNVGVGQKVIVALPGAVLPGGTIKKSHQFREECGFSRIAGVRSHIDHPGNTLRLV